MQDLIIWFQINTADSLREWQIGSFAAQAAILFIGFAIYFKKGISSSEILSLRSFYYKLAVFFLIFSFSIFLNISGVYYSSNPDVSYMKITFAVGTGLAGITIFIQNLEHLEIINTKRILTLLSADVTVAILMFSLLPPNIIMPILALPIWLLIPFIFFYISFQKQGKIRLKSFFLAFGFLLFFGGLIVIPDLFENSISNIYNSTNSILYIYYNYISFGLVYIGILMILCFGSINFFVQGKWTEKIDSIYIFLKNGDDLIHKVLNNKKNPQLIAEWQNQIKLYLENSVKTDKTIKVIEKEGKFLFFEEGIHTVALMIAEENQKIFEKKIKAFLRDFELLYGEFLSNWDGDLNIFESAYPLIDRHFQ